MKAAAAALAGIVIATTPSLAADLFGSAPPPLEAPEPPMVEVGSNWYIRGDVGASLDTLPEVTFSSLSAPPQGGPSKPFTSSGSSNWAEEFSGDVGIGYRVNNFFRLEGMYEYLSGFSGSSSATVVCPYGAYGVSSQPQSGSGQVTEYGYLYNPTNTCSGVFDLKQHNNLGLANAYVDLGTWWGFTPYIGAGVGVNAATTSGSLTFFETANGQVYNADLSPTGTYPQIWVDALGHAVPHQNIAFTTQNWNRSFSTTKYSVAVALMAGVGIQLTPSATLDIGYRYLNTGVSTLAVTSPAAATIKNANVSQEIKVGIRYMAN